MRRGEPEGRDTCVLPRSRERKIAGLRLRGDRGRRADRRASGSPRCTNHDKHSAGNGVGQKEVGGNVRNGVDEVWWREDAGSRDRTLVLTIHPPSYAQAKEACP